MKRLLAIFSLLVLLATPAAAVEHLKQSTAVTIAMGPFVDETDGKTAETALTLSQADFRLKKNGGDAAQKNDATSATHDEIGVYDVPLNTTDTATLGRLEIFVHEAGALPVWKEFMVLPANAYDSLYGSDRLEVDVREFGGTAGAFANGVPSTNPRSLPNVWYVDDDASDANDGKTVATAKATIGATLTAATDGSTIYIMPGSYPENVVISKRGITLQGMEREAVVIEPATGKAISVARANTTIRNLTASGVTPTTPGATDGVGIYCFSHDGLRVESCIVNGDYDGLDCNGSDNPVIIGSVITGKYDGGNLANCKNVNAQDTTFVSTANFSGADSGFRACHATGNSNDPTVESTSGRFVDCNFVITRTTAGSNAISALELSGNWSLVGCKLAAKATHASFSANVYGLRETFSTPKLSTVHIVGGSITTSTAGSGTAYDIHNAVSGSKYQLASVSFSAAKASGSNYEVLQPTTLGTRLDVTANGEAGIDWANIGNPNATVNLSGSTVGTLTTYTGNTPQTGDAFLRLGAPDTTTIAADIGVATSAAQSALTQATAAASSSSAVQGKLPTAGAKMAGEGTTAKNLDQVEGGGGTISREDADMVAARVNAHRGEFYPNAKQVWVLKRSTSGLEVKNGFQISKGAGETLKVWIDFASVMGRNEFVEEITSLSLSGGTATIVADSEEIVGNLVSFSVTGGAAEDATAVSFEVLSTEDQVISSDVCEFTVVE